MYIRRQHKPRRFRTCIGRGCRYRRACRCSKSIPFSRTGLAFSRYRTPRGYSSWWTLNCCSTGSRAPSYSRIRTTSCIERSQSPNNSRRHPPTRNRVLPCTRRTSHRSCRAAYWNLGNDRRSWRTRSRAPACTPSSQYRCKTTGSAFPCNQRPPLRLCRLFRRSACLARHPDRRRPVPRCGSRLRRCSIRRHLAFRRCATPLRFHLWRHRRSNRPHRCSRCRPSFARLRSRCCPLPRPHPTRTGYRATTPWCCSRSRSRPATRCTRTTSATSD